MEKFEQILTEKERKKLIAKNKKKIKKALAAVNPETMELFSQMIDDAASYSCAIYECNLLYMRDGIAEYYQNGENQWGVKKSVAAELRVKYTDAYQKLIGRLAELLPSEDEKAAAAELMDFINQG